MDVYTSEHDQVEALRRWWEKNGRTAVIALVVGVAAILGWRTWQENQALVAEAASAEYQGLLSSMEAAPDKVMEQGRAIVADFPDSPYAVLASLAMAKASVESSELDAAAAHLRWAMDHAKLAGTRQLAAVRLARVLMEQGKPQEALTLLNGTDAAGFKGPFAEARGDALLALGERAKARAAYEEALAAYADVPSKQPLVTMKLDDLAGAGGEGQ